MLSPLHSCRYPPPYRTPERTNRRWRPYYRVHAGMFPFYCSTPSKKKALFWLKEAQDIGLEAELHIHRQRIVYERPPHHRTRSLRRMHRQIQMYGFTRNAP